MPSMIPLRQDILGVLAGGPMSASALAQTLNAPAPSIRRAVGELRQAGYDITLGDTGYTHVASPVPQMAAALQQ